MDSSSFSPVAPAVLHHATLALHSAASLHELLETFTRQAARLCALESGNAQLALHREALAAVLRDEAAPLRNLSFSEWPPDEDEWLLIGKFQTAAEKCVWPLALRGQNVAVLRVAAPRMREDAASLAKMLWEQAGVALEKARLFDQLERAKREWETVFDGMADGIFIYEADGVILRANLALSQLIATPLREIVGKKRDELFASLPEYLELESEKRLEDSPASLDFRRREFRCQVPERIFEETSFVLRSDDDLDRVDRAQRIGVLHDVTESRLLQEQVIQAEKLAALGELLSGVAHELNNPLATVVGYAQLLETDSTLPAHLQRQVHAVNHEAQRASQIVQSLLDFSRRTTLEKTRLDLNDVVRAVLGMRAFQLEKDNVEIETDCAENLPLIWGDPAGLQQVLLNIVNNGIHAIRDAQNQRENGTIFIRTEAVHLAGQFLVRLTIRDDGPGIPAEYLRRIFDPFFTTKAPGKGTGLGMSLAHRTISNHGGTIRAESRMGSGATFIIELPVAGTGVSERTSPDAKRPSAPHSHVLVVDDEEPIVLLMTEILAAEGHRVTAAYNGAEALVLLEKEEFDLIVSDVRMPAVGGPTFFEALQTSHPNLLPKVIFVTGDTMSASTRAFLEKTGRPVLVKPFDPERLCRMVNENLQATA